MTSQQGDNKTKKKEEKVPLKQTDNIGIEEGYEYATVPPDGGFGWVIAIAAMLCNLVCDGTLFAFGTMKIHLQEHFKCSDMLILMVGSVPCGVYLLVGPIVSGLANRYGCRIIIIIGSIGAAICMALSTLSPNVWAMMIIYGVFGGIFFGMVYLPSVVMVSFYFEKRRAIANGLVTAGTGLGALSFGPLANFLMSKLGWRIGMLILAGIMLTCIAFGAIMRPLKPVKRRIVLESEDELSADKNSKDEKQKALHANSQEPTIEATIPLLSKGDGSNVHQVESPSVETVGKTLGSTGASSRVRSFSSSSRTSVHSGHHLPHGVANPEDAARPLYKKDALFMGSKVQLHTSHTSLQDSNPYVASVTNIPDAVGNEMKDSAVKAFVNILVAMTDFSILKNKQLLLICIGNIFSMLGYYLPILCLVSYAVDDHHVSPSTAALLSTIFGSFNTLGRFASGPITMIPLFSALRVHNAFLFIAGVSTVLAAYTTNFLSCAIYAALCGFTIAPHMSLLPNVIFDCVGMDRYTTAFGILFLFRGVTSIIGPPAAGFLKDYTRRYDLAFVLGGAMIIIGSFFHIAIVCFERTSTAETAKNEDKEIEAQKNKLDV